RLQHAVLFTLEIDGQTRLEQPVSAERLMPLAVEVDAPVNILQDFIEPLRSILQADGKRVKTFCLCFEQPSGMLPSLPWELILQKGLRCRVIRQPYLPFTYEVPRQFDIILCAYAASAAQAAKLAGDVRKKARAICDLYNATTLHVYADQATYDILAKIRWPAREGFHVKQYNPHQRARQQRSASPDVLDVHNDFLTWITNTFPATRAADIVHFMTPTYRGSTDVGIELPNFTVLG